eukprot:gene6987-14202_t
MPSIPEKENEIAIPVPTKGKGDDSDKSKKAAKKDQPDELSEEDQALKEGLELAVTRLQEPETNLHKQALDHLCSEIKSSTSSMTSVPKPLKFLRLHYDALKQVYSSWAIDHEMKGVMADMLSVLAMAMAPQGSRECLKFRLESAVSDISSWGHEYIRSLAGEISSEYNVRTSVEDEVDMNDLLGLVDAIVPFQMQHNAEAEAIDLLIEVQRLPQLMDTPAVDERNFERVCLYLLRCADFTVDPDDLSDLLNAAYCLYRKHGKYTDALRVALKMDDNDKLTELFSSSTSSDTVVTHATESMKKQMALTLARHRSNFVSEDESLNELIGNTKLSDYFLSVARALDVLEPKTAEDIFKSHLAEGGMARTRGMGMGAAAPVDSARANLATSFVNAFANAGFGKDKLVTEGGDWVFKNKDHGMMSAAASLGLVLLWNVEEGLNQIDKYFHNTEDYIRAGACLAIGVVSSGVRNESDPALALLSDYVDSTSHPVRCAAISGLGIAYAGTQREELLERLLPAASNTESANMVEVSLAGLTLGMIFVGTCNEEVGSALVQRLMEATETELNQSATRFLCLGLGLLYLGKGELADAMLEAVKTVDHRIGKYAEITLETCAHAGTGNVLKVQRMLLICAEHLTENAEHQAVAVLGIALTALGEDIGTEMSLRTFEHLLHYGGLPVKRVVPLAMALLYVSHPDYAVVDQLSRLSHDADPELAQGAIFALGLVSAGTNNSRVAGLLRQLSEFYSKEANHLFMVRIAQGLNSLGKGLIGLNPFHSDRLLMNGTAVAGLLTVLHACLDLKNTILDKMHYILFFLTPAMNPRFLLTLDEDLNVLPVSVRVGQAVETVGQAGRPKTITGFQTHTTPVMLSHKDRAELAVPEMRPLTSVMEGVVILEKVLPPQL